MQILDRTLKDILNQKLNELELYFDADVIFYYGEIHPSFEKAFRDFIEQIRDEEDKKKRLVIILNSPGGSAETTEKMVGMIRYHYKEVYFVVPDYALSAGTIFCMSGDKIYMDYSSSLGPIDPQVYNGTKYVPALGYLDKVSDMIEKSKKGELSQAEYLMLQSLDLAELRSYEQAKDLTVSLLKEWLVNYKFKDWTIHQTNPDKKGQAVTIAEKEARAEEIAKLLGDNKIWHSHGRFIGINTLQSVLKLRIEDYSENEPFRNLIRSYNDLICEYITRSGYQLFLHSRYWF